MRCQSCVICGAGLFTYSAPLKYLHCTTDDCSEAFAVREFRRLAQPEGECLIWSGPTAKGIPNIYLRGDAGKGRQRSARKQAVIMAGDRLAAGDSFVVTCGNQRCVKHIRVQRAVPTGTRKPRPRLSAEPLLRLSEHLPQSQRQTLRQSAAKGYLTIEQVDLYCIKYLHTHPCMIYGPEFFAA